MKKLNASDEMYKKIKNFYLQGEDSEIKIEVINNLFNGPQREKWEKNLDPKWKKFLKFFKEDRVASPLIQWRIYEMLTDKYGRCDFKFEGNREYRNWMVEHEGLYFILSTKSELVLPRTKEQSLNLGNALVSLHFELFNMALNFCKNYPETYGEGFSEVQKHLQQLEKKNIIKNNQFNQEFHAFA